MATKFTGKYLGDKQVILTHLDNSATIHTDAPKDNNGLGRNFSPTDMFASSLGSCIMTVMGIVADRDEIDLSGMHLELEKRMSTSPRRIGAILVDLHLPEKLSDAEKSKLENVANSCPVHKSLHPDIEAPINFIYDV